MLGVSVSTVHNYFDAGLLGGFRRYGGHRRVSLASVRVMIAEDSGRPPRRGPGGRPRKDAA